MTIKSGVLVVFAVLLFLVITLSGAGLLLILPLYFIVCVLGILLLAGAPKYIIVKIFFQNYIFASPKKQLNVMIAEAVLIAAIFSFVGIFNKSEMQVINSLLKVSESFAIFCFSILTSNSRIFNFLVTMICLLPLYVPIASALNILLINPAFGINLPNISPARKMLLVGSLSIIAPTIVLFTLSLYAVRIDLNDLLIKSSYMGSPALTDALIRKGADVNAKGKFGMSVLHYAFGAFGTHVVNWGGDSKGTIKLLIEKGADINAKNRDGRTVLMEAIMGRETREEDLNELLNKGPDLNAKDIFGDTALAKALALRNFDKANLLLQNGADINAALYGGDTPLMQACRKGNLDVVRFLIEKGADIHIRNNCGRTAVQVARMEGANSTTQMLLDHGAELSEITEPLLSCEAYKRNRKHTQ